jgi:hypothetical protein
MLNLAAVRYRDILSKNGGPIANIETSVFLAQGKTLFQSLAYLKPEYSRNRSHIVYCNADGTGTHSSPTIARFIAVSEALERWAFYETTGNCEAANYGFNIDPSSNGMAAFPGLFSIQARKRAVLEAAERFSVIAWWERKADGKLLPTKWKGVSAVSIQGPFQSITCIAFKELLNGNCAYGHAAAPTFSQACDRAVLEMSRHELVIALLANNRQEPSVDVLERRAVFFASPKGFARFKDRIVSATLVATPQIKVVCDKEIKGPWTKYATVWRVAIRQASDRFLSDDQEFFFW